jgi:hypothetical protein
MNTTRKSQRPPNHREIAGRAYEIYEREGRPAGRDFDHWLKAEAQLIAERTQPAHWAKASKRLTPASKVELKSRTEKTTLATSLITCPSASPRALRDD